MATAHPRGFLRGSARIRWDKGDIPAVGRAVLSWFDAEHDLLACENAGDGVH